MPELRALYQEVIIDHGRHPRNFGVLPHANCHHEGFNPLCGDKIIVYLHKKNNTIEELSFDGSGCAISMASASLMTECIKNKSIAEINELIALFHQWMTETESSDAVQEKLGKLAVLSGVRAFPVRVKCATLAWHTLKAALASEPLITLTDAAIHHIKNNLEKQSHGIGFRLSIKKTGCSGYAYTSKIIDKIIPTDLHFMAQDALPIYIDPACEDFLNGLVIDYMADNKTGLKQKRLVFLNRNEKNRCGCGESFTIE